jgi:hypothetical protein
MDLTPLNRAALHTLLDVILLADIYFEINGDYITVDMANHQRIVNKNDTKGLLDIQCRILTILEEAN